MLAAALFPPNHLSLSAYVNGVGLGFSLIVAIGAQNAFVLRQGLRGEHVLLVCLTCALSDALLISGAVAGFARITTAAPWLMPVLRYGGAGFLLWYGALRLRAALGASETLQGSDDEPQSAIRVFTACMGFTWLNPHCYLDVALLGSIASQFPKAQTSFATGAITASLVFFFALGFGARALRPVLAKPSVWRVIEGGIALTMFAVATRLALG